MKHTLLMLMLCFGFVQVAYAQEDTVRVDTQVKSAKRVDASRIKTVDLARQQLENQKQAQEVRAEAKAEFKLKAQDAQAELKAEFRTATSTEAKQAIREKASVEKEQLRAEAQEYKEQWRANVQEFFKNRITSIFAQFNQLIEKAQSVNTRITEVVDRLSQAGIDTSEVTQRLTGAQTLVSEVQVTMRTVKVSLEASVETGSREEVKDAFNQAREELAEAQRKLRTAYKEIREAVALLKKLVADQKNETKINVQTEIQITDEQ